jgi:hypothetical protein
MGDVVQLSAMTFAAVEILKQAGMPSRFAGLAAIVIGIAFAVLDGSNRGEPTNHAGGWIATGFVAGLTAAGMYSAPKAMTRLPSRRLNHNATE